MEEEVDVRWFFALIGLFATVAALNVGLIWFELNGFDRADHAPAAEVVAVSQR